MNPHILFAEDDPDTRNMIQLLLTNAGVRVSAPESAVDALTLATTEHFDAVLLDNWIPEVSGIASVVRSEGYVGKPFDPEDLIGALREALRKS